MKREHRYSEVQRKHFLAGIAGRSRPEDRPVLDIIAIDYKGNTDDYMDVMLRYDPETRKYLD
jgi:hypothetical protein